MAPVAERVSGLLEHRRIDPENDQLLDALIGAFTAPLERAGLIAYGDDGTIRPGAALNDPVVAPDWALPHAALWTGGTMPTRLAGETDEEYIARARDAVVFPRGMRRGTHESIRLALAPHLTGTKTVAIIDDEGDPHDLTVRVRASECPDPAVAERAVQGSYISGGDPTPLPAWLVLNFIVSDDVIWDEVNPALTWDEVDPALGWDDVTAADVT